MQVLRSNITPAAASGSRALAQGLFFIYQFGVAAAGLSAMINAAAEMTMTGTHAIPNQLAQCHQALDFRKIGLLLPVFGDLFQI
jgi:hypothetical protein